LRGPENIIAAVAADMHIDRQMVKEGANAQPASLISPSSEPIFGVK
jgi:hypothetical protein